MFTILNKISSKNHEIQNVVALLFAFIVVVSVFVFKTKFGIPNLDNEWLLDVARRYINGGHYYDDFLEINPPLIILLNVPAIWISDALNIDPYTAFVGWVCLLTVMAAVVARPWLDRITGRWRHIAWVGYVIMLLWLPGPDFGQREHLMIIFLAPSLPWLVCRDSGLVGVAGLRLSLPVVVLAALGVLIKPYMAVLPLLLLGLWFYRERSVKVLLDPHVLVFGGISAGMGAIVLLFFRDYFRVIPLVLDLYSGYDSEIYPFIIKLIKGIVAVSAIVVLTELLPVSRVNRNFVRYSAFYAAVGLFVFLVQWKDWSNHFLIAKFFLYVEGLGLVFELLNRFAGHVVLVGLADVVVLGFLGQYIYRDHGEYVSYLSELNNGQEDSFPAVCKELGSHRKVMILTTSSNNIYPLVSLIDAKLSARVPDQWLVPGIIMLQKQKDVNTTKLDHFVSLYSTMIAEDMAVYKPDLIAIRTGVDLSVDEPFDYVKILDTTPAFRQQWSEFTLVRRIDGWDFYQHQPAAVPAG